MNFSAVILAGGKSSRMGRDKAWLEIEGLPLLARQIKLARELGAVEIFISGRPENDYSEFVCPVLQDKFAGAGPLAGIERALAAATSSLLLVLAVDLPALQVNFFQQLAAACSDHYGAIPTLAGRIEPLAAFYPKSARLLAASLLCGRENAVATFAQYCVRSGLAQFVAQPPGAASYFMNWNSPSDLVSEATNDPPAS